MAKAISKTTKFTVLVFVERQSEGIIARTQELVAFLIALSAGLWWLLRKIVRDLAVSVDQVAAEATPSLGVSPRALAVWALVSALVIVPIGAALGPAWEQIRAVILTGSP